ncbi:MAG TPA: hypothetical protein VG317_19815 [Pseudonocardiaceae bacterium]|jgi:hypothetical protein|nr:hypothetical protein [Pseudonocardiaceae bacterium]
MTRKAARLAAFIRIVSSIILALTLVAFGSPALAAHADTDPCAAQSAALDQIQQQIDAHNAEPHTFIVPEEQAAADAYDAEADQLNATAAQAESALQDCQDTLGVLANSGPNAPPLKTQAPDSLRDKLNDAKAKLPPNVQQYTSPDAKGNWRIPPQLRQLYDLLRNKNPGLTGQPYLQNEPPPQAGDPDPAYPGRTIQAKAGPPGQPPTPDLRADHIIPLAQLLNEPGFLELNADNMYMVSRAPLNLQWLSARANSLKASKSAADMENLDPAWQDQQVTLENSVRSQLRQVIQQLIASQH